MLDDVGRMLMLLGGVLFVIGPLIVLLGKLPGLGRLPGDILIQRDNFTFYMPLATMILVSLLLTILLNLLARLLR